MIDAKEPQIKERDTNDKLAYVITRVKELYSQPNLVIDWNEWVFNDHVKVVDQWVVEIAKRHTFDVEKTRMAAYLHDIAYAWTNKNDAMLDDQSYAKAREVLADAGLTASEVSFVIDDVIAKHSANDGPLVAPIEAQVLATADALAHIMSDFYIALCWKRHLFEDKTLGDYKSWVLKKIERDFNNKISFEDYREIAKPSYEALKVIFSKNTI